MENYELFLQMVFESEGFYSNDSDDSGGVTYFGLTSSFLKSIDWTNGPPTQAEAAYIYEQYIWYDHFLDEYHPVVAFCYGDALINHSPGAANKIIQYALRIKMDGIAGIQTKTSLATVNDVMDFWLRYREYRIRYYVKISKYRNNKKFLIGWLVRIHRIGETIYLNGLDRRGKDQSPL